MIKHRNVIKRYYEMDISGLIPFTDTKDVWEAIDRFIEAIDASNLCFGGGCDLEDGNLVLAGGIIFDDGPKFKDRGMKIFNEALAKSGLKFEGLMDYRGCAHSLYTYTKRTKKK